jgi:hypothetical protein
MGIWYLFDDDASDDDIVVADGDDDEVRKEIPGTKDQVCTKSIPSMLHGTVNSLYLRPWLHK